MKKLINVTFALLLLCSAVTLVSCGKDDDKKGGSEAPEGTRELTQNGINARIVQERWGGAGGNTVLYVNLLLTKSNANTKTNRKSIFTSENYRWTSFAILEQWC